MKVQVHHEWGALKEVICGIPFFKIPAVLPQHIYNYTPDEGISFMEQNAGKTLEEASPELYKKTAKQMEDVVDILTSRGIKVHRPKQLIDIELNYIDNIIKPSATQFYPRDPLIVIGNQVIESELNMPLRRRERFGIRRSLKERLENSGAQVVSMPPAQPCLEDENGDWGPGPFLEGGDTFLLGKNIYVGVSGNATNTAGVRWLQQYLGDSYQVHEIKLTKKFLHLDCCLTTPREGLAIICKEAFIDGVPEFLSGCDLIDISFQDAKEKLGCNGLVLDEKTIIIADTLPHLAKQLREKGQEVIEMPFDAVYQYGGAFRCWHHPLIRESSL